MSTKLNSNYETTFSQHQMFIGPDDKNVQKRSYNEESTSNFVQRSTRETSPDIFSDTIIPKKSFAAPTDCHGITNINIDGKPDNLPMNVQLENVVYRHAEEIESDITSTLPSNSQSSSWKESDYEPSSQPALGKNFNSCDQDIQYVFYQSRKLTKGRQKYQSSFRLNFDGNRNDFESDVSSSLTSSSQSSLQASSQESSLKESDYEPVIEEDVMNGKACKSRIQNLYRMYRSKYFSSEDYRVLNSDDFTYDKKCEEYLDANDFDISSSFPSDSQSSLPMLSQSSSIIELDDQPLCYSESISTKDSNYLADISCTSSDGKEGLIIKTHRLRKHKKYEQSSNGIINKLPEGLSKTTIEGDFFSLTSTSETENETSRTFVEPIPKENFGRYKKCTAFLKRTGANKNMGITSSEVKLQHSLSSSNVDQENAENKPHANRRAEKNFKSLNMKTEHLRNSSPSGYHLIETEDRLETDVPSHNIFAGNKTPSKLVDYDCESTDEATCMDDTTTEFYLSDKENEPSKLPTLKRKNSDASNKCEILDQCFKKSNIDNDDNLPNKTYPNMDYDDK